MKILVGTDFPWLFVNGIHTFAHNLVEGLVRHGHEVMVIAPSPTGKYQENKRDGYLLVEVRSLKNLAVRSGGQDHRMAFNCGKQVQEAIERFQPDVIHIQTPLEVGLRSLWEARRRGLPIVNTSHSMPENVLDNLKMMALVKPLKYPASKLLYLYGSRLYNQADYVTFPTESAAKQGIGNGFSTPYSAISNGIDTDRFSPGQAPNSLRQRYGLDERPIVLYIGRVDNEKHLEAYLHGFARVRKNHDVQGLVVGSGNALAGLEQLATELKVGDNVTFTGYVEDEILPDLFRLGSVFVMPSPAELQSIATLEAASTGLPIVAVNAVALPELCHDGKNGYLVAVDDDKAVAKAIESILSDPALARRMGVESRRIALTHALDKTIKAYEAIYERVIKQKQQESAAVRQQLWQKLLRQLRVTRPPKTD